LGRRQRRDSGSTRRPWGTTLNPLLQMSDLLGRQRLIGGHRIITIPLNRLQKQTLLRLAWNNRRFA
jgi:hypothetical protein